MTPEQLIRHYDTPTAAAAALGTDRQRVHGWMARGKIPLQAQVDYEVATDGALRADLPASIRRPGLRVAK